MAAQDFPGKHDTPAAIPPQDRVILHCDMNGFFASVELLERPELRDVPMAVCGDPDSRHGIILAKNEPAKKIRHRHRRDPLAGQTQMSRAGASAAARAKIPSLRR